MYTLDDVQKNAYQRFQEKNQAFIEKAAKTFKLSKETISELIKLWEDRQYLKQKWLEAKIEAEEFWGKVED